MLHQLSKHDKIVVQCNHLSTRKILDTEQYSVVGIYREQYNTHVRHNTTQAKAILDALNAENETDDANFRTENINAPAIHTKENTHQPNIKKITQEKYEN